MKHILLPTDFSENSLNAITYALQFFKNWTCDFYILNVQKSSEYITDDLMAASPRESVHSSIASDNKKLLRELIGTLQKEYAQETYIFHPLFDYDNFTAAVQQAVQMQSIDLIIMGTNGATSAKEVLFGSNTIRVLRNVTCPILVVPEDYSYSNIAKVLFCIEDVDELNENTITALKDVLQIHQPQLHLLDLEPDAIQVSRKKENPSIEKHFQEFPYRYYYVNELLDWKVLNTASQLLDSQLNTVFLHKEPLWERLLLGSETTAITYGTRVPLLFLYA